MLVHENALVQITKDMPLDKAALLSCGVLTGVGAVLNRAKVEPASTVAVFGVGGIGMSVIHRNGCWGKLRGDALAWEDGEPTERSPARYSKGHCRVKVTACWLALR